MNIDKRTAARVASRLEALLNLLSMSDMAKAQTGIVKKRDLIQLQSDVQELKSGVRPKTIL